MRSSRVLTYARPRTIAEFSVFGDESRDRPKTSEEVCKHTSRQAKTSAAVFIYQSCHALGFVKNRITVTPLPITALQPLELLVCACGPMPAFSFDASYSDAQS